LLNPPGDLVVTFPIAAHAVCLPAEAGEPLVVRLEPAPTGEYVATVGQTHAADESLELALCRAVCESGHQGYKPIAVGAQFDCGGQLIGGLGWVTIVDGSGSVVELTAAEKERFAQSGFVEGFAYAAEILARGSL